MDGLAIIQVPPAGGDIRGTAPQVRATYPKATGWPLSVPVVIEFSQSMNEASIFPTSATVNDAKVIVRVKGTATGAARAIQLHRWRPAAGDPTSWVVGAE